MEEKNNGFFKGFWVGFGVFLVCAVLIGGVMLYRASRKEAAMVQYRKQETAGATPLFAISL